MAKKPKIEIDEIPNEAALARGDELLKRMLKTKPKPHKAMVGKAKSKPTRSKSKARQ